MDGVEWNEMELNGMVFQKRQMLMKEGVWRGCACNSNDVDVFLVVISLVLWLLPDSIRDSGCAEERESEIGTATRRSRTGDPDGDYSWSCLIKYNSLFE